MFSRIFNRSQDHKLVASLSAELYGKIVTQSRKDDFYTRFQISDSPQGRLEMLIVHLFMVLYVLRHKKDLIAPKVSQHLVDFFVVDMDQSLRELFISDKKMIKSFRYALEGFYGRLYSYDAAFDNDKAAFKQVLYKNIYQGLVDEHSEVLYLLSDYIYYQIDYLKQIPVMDIGFA